jgi:large subunit ribosomal protein L18e
VGAGVRNPSSAAWRISKQKNRKQKSHSKGNKMVLENKHEELKKLVSELKKLSIDKKVNLWKRVAEDLESSTRRHRIVNVYKLSKSAKANEIIIVPGKVLGTGDIDSAVTVAAYKFSDEAERKISEKGKIMTIEELMKKNPTAKNVRIIG